MVRVFCGATTMYKTLISVSRVTKTKYENGEKYLERPKQIEFLLVLGGGGLY